jgi:hypothetical protein
MSSSSRRMSRAAEQPLPPGYPPPRGAPTEIPDRGVRNGRPVPPVSWIDAGLHLLFLAAATVAAPADGSVLPRPGLICKR